MLQCKVVDCPDYKLQPICYTDNYVDDLNNWIENYSKNAFRLNYSTDDYISDLGCWANDP